MTKSALAAAAALAFAFALAPAPPASAWHLASRRACLKHASAPDCGVSGVAVCLSRKACLVEPHRTRRVCAAWRCEPRASQ